MILSLPCVCILGIHHESLVTSLFPLTLYLTLVKPLERKSASLGNTLEMLKLIFNTTVLVNPGVCFIKGKETLLTTLRASSWFSTQIQTEKKIYSRKKCTNNFICEIISLFFIKVRNLLLSTTSSRIAYGLVLK